MPLTKVIIQKIVAKHVPTLRESSQINSFNLAPFRQAMVHSSVNKRYNYERLEFLGDAVFHYCISDYIYHRYPEEEEGFLTKMRICLERDTAMAELCRDLELDSCIQSTEKITDKELEDVMEAFIGAFYLVFGSDHTYELVQNSLECYKDFASMIEDDCNYKDVWLRYCHRRVWGNTVYRNTMKNGVYTSRAGCEGKPGVYAGQGTGDTQKDAEQNASRDALEKEGIVKDGRTRTGWEADYPLESETPSIGGIITHNPTNKALMASDIRNLLKIYNIRLTGRINKSLFQQACTHRSYVKHRKLTREEREANIDCVPLGKSSNDRLQFLGNAVAHLVYSEMLYHRYKEENEGYLTVVRSRIERKDAVSYLAYKSGVEPYILISTFLEDNGGRENKKITGGVLEAWFGAVHLSYGLETTRELILTMVERYLNMESLTQTETNYRDLVKQLCKEQDWSKPIFKVLRESGPDHQKTFCVGIYVDDMLLARGKSGTKKEASHAACQALIEKVKRADGQT